jgi:uncharacterized membrane protein YdbT with pleckstrin-like domain
MFRHYVDKVLQPGEQVRYRASLNWILYVPGLALWLVALALYVVISVPFFQVVSLVVFAAGLYLVARAWFDWYTTEIAVTDRRVIYKTGFISRKTTEMHMDKIESVDVDQSVLGRILDYGDVMVRGTGSGLSPIRNVDAPIELRNHITGV